jgi:three-Cys-motif partner protein
VDSAVRSTSNSLAILCRTNPISFELRLFIRALEFVSTAGPFFAGTLDAVGKGSKDRTRTERGILLESECSAPVSDYYRRVKPHGLEKLQSIRGYLWSYSVIQNIHHAGRFGYVDALAGPGILDLRVPRKEHQSALTAGPLPGELALGSPLLALSNHPHYPIVRLVEESPQPFRALSTRVDHYYPGRAELSRGDCNSLLPGVASSLVNVVDNALFLLDPEGLEVQFATIRRIKENFPGAELLILYPSFMAVARCIVHRPSFPKLDKFFGDELDEGVSRWVEIVELSDEGIPDDPEDDDYIDEPHVGESNPVHARLLAHYVSQLRRAGNSAVEVSPIVRSEKGRPLYHMIFAGNNDTGAKIIREIFRSAHRRRGR